MNRLLAVNLSTALIVALGLLACDNDEKPTGPQPGPAGSGKATDDDCALCDLFGAFDDAQEEAEDEAEEAAETDSTSSDEPPEEVPDDAPFSIPDAELRAAIALELGKVVGATITKDDMTRLTYLNNTGRGVRDLTGLEFATNLIHLFLGNNEISDLSPLRGLTNLRNLGIHNNEISDLSPLRGLTNLVLLNLGRNKISDLSPLRGLTNLRNLLLGHNLITDLSPLAGLTNLEGLDLSYNTIMDSSPLAGLTNLKELNLKENPIFEFAASEGTEEPTTYGYIYNDNVFVLPVSEDLARGFSQDRTTRELPLEEYAVRFYEDFSDEFDFLIFISSPNDSQRDPEAYGGAFYRGVWDDVQGIGFSSDLFDADYGSSRKLRGVIYFAGIKRSDSWEHSQLVDGPMLHELMHCWANFIVPPYSDPHWNAHWDFTSANGILGGFDIDDLENLGDGQYRAPNALTGGWAVNLKPYSPIELYLAGFIPPEEVPGLWVGVDGEYVRGSVWWDLFTASRVRTYSIEDIIAEHGPRVPNHMQSQKDFRAAVILLVSDEFPAPKGPLNLLSYDASLFSYPGSDQLDERYNFYEATGGRATMAMDGLSQFKRDPGAAKRPALPSYGTPRPPIICHWH